jgi:hypothetical protein
MYDQLEVVQTRQGNRSGTLRNMFNAATANGRPFLLAKLMSTKLCEH